MPKESANRSDPKLLADLAGKAVVDLGVTRHWDFRAVGHIRIYRVTAAFSI
jgi:hypothetical protein